MSDDGVDLLVAQSAGERRHLAILRALANLAANVGIGEARLQRRVLEVRHTELGHHPRVRRSTVTVAACARRRENGGAVDLAPGDLPLARRRDEGEDGEREDTQNRSHGHCYHVRADRQRDLASQPQPPASREPAPPAPCARPQLLSYTAHMPRLARLFRGTIPGLHAGLALIVLTASGCGPSVTHDGYKSLRQQPWKSPKELTFDEDSELEVDDQVDYPRRRRAKWYAVDLPAYGNLKLRLTVQPLEDESKEIDIAMEVLDSTYRVIATADADDEDAGDLNKRRTLEDLDAGRYYIHVYAQRRLDRADYTLRGTYERGSKAYESTFPYEVPYVGILPAVPLFDDTPPKPEPKRIVHSKRPVAKPTTTVRGRISGITTTAKGTQIKIDRGSSQGVDKGWRGVVVTKSGKAIENGQFTVSKVSSSESYGLVKATQDAVTAAKYVRLSPP